LGLPKVILFPFLRFPIFLLAPYTSAWAPFFPFLPRVRPREGSALNPLILPRCCDTLGYQLEQRGDDNRRYVDLFSIIYAS
jgi:hypothetical protein